MRRIFLIEDDASITKLLKLLLEKEGYIFASAFSAEEALATLKNFTPDLILLDLNLPGMNGYEFSEILKNNPKFSTVLIAILSGKNSEEEQILGLSKCADMYISKPFTPPYLVAAVNALMRKKAKFSKLIIEGIEIEEESASVTIDGQPSELTKIEFSLLSYMIRNRDKYCSREEIITAVYGENFAITPRTIDYHVCKLRKKIKPYEHVLQSFPGIGYRISSPKM